MMVNLLSVYKIFSITFFFGAEGRVPIIKLTHDPTQNRRIPFIDWRSLGPILKNIISHKNSKNEVA